MTNEEIIQGLYRGDNKAIDMAIKALEQQPCEDECITKAEAINTIHKTIYGFFDIADDDSEEPINDKDKLLLTINKAISNAVKALPSVTPQPKMGKWIFVHPLQEDDEGAYMCSCCGIGNWGIDPKVDKYCFNCGADMEGEDNDKI